MGSGVKLNEEYFELLSKGLKINDFFIKEILFDFDNFNDMDQKEAEIVNYDFVKRDDTYNMIVGGRGAYLCSKYGYSMCDEFIHKYREMFEYWT